MARVFVTGASGFVGRFLCEKLIKEGHHVTGFVRSLPKNPVSGVTYVIGDLETIDHHKDLIQSANYVIHLAARVHHMNDDPKNDVLYDRINHQATNRLVDVCKGSSALRRFVFLSTIFVNGQYSNPVFTEDSPICSDNPYAKSKWMAEEYLKKSSTPHTIIRPPLIYGPKAPGNLERLSKLIQKGWPLPFANFSNRKSFIYIGNLVDFIAKSMEHDKGLNETFLIADPDVVSTSRLMTMIAYAMNQKLRLYPFPWSLLWPVLPSIIKKNIEKLSKNLEIDTSKAREFIRWAAPFSTEQGIQETFK
jgi:nucleoside-diphosphate-sugar epimerase